MPKIKVKNIPYQTLERICSGTPCGSQCPFYTDATVLVNNYLEHITCLRDARYDPKEMCIELSEQEFPTNREWMESLSNKELALFLRSYRCTDLHPKTIEEWLSKPCVHLMEREEE